MEFETRVVQGIVLPKADDHFADHIRQGPVHCGFGTYQFNKFTACLPFIDRNKTAYDIGAHVGLWSMMLATVCKQVVAYEPVAELIECHRANCAQFRNVKLITKAVGNENGTIEVSYVPGNTGNSCIGLGRPVEITTIDNRPEVHRRRNGLGFIKIDVEGYELNVIQGAEQTIKDERCAVLIEQKPGNAERYGIKQHAARDLLVEWGMTEMWCKSGDHFLMWR